MFTMLVQASGTRPEVDVASRAGGAPPDESVVAYASVAFRGATGCTPTLKRWSDGSISWGGCPTIECVTDDCVADTTDADDALSCKCQDDGAGVLCKGTVYFLPTGEVSSWGCVTVNCGPANGDDCWWQEAPPAPPSGYEKFAVCWCGQ